MRKTIVLVAFLLLSVVFIFAQRTTTYHQSFLIEEGVSSVELNLEYPVQVESWLGNTVLVETNVGVHNASKQIMEFFIESGRYTVVRADTPDKVTLSLKKMPRKTITTRKGICEEEILYKVFVPSHLKVNTLGAVAVSTQ